MPQAIEGTAPSGPAVPEHCLLCGGRHRTHLMPGGRRMLTLEETAAHLNVSKSTIRKLIKIQRDEDTAAFATGRPAKRLGLRSSRLGPHVTRIREADIVALQDG